jgi:tetratricopeptide (TPR) repeat protein
MLVFSRDKRRCRICGRGSEDGVKLTVDHRLPLAKGGTDDITNLWTLCFDCNQGKGDLILGESIPESSIANIPILSKKEELSLWQNYFNWLKTRYGDLDFIGISNLREEKPLPLSELFINLHFLPDPNSFGILSVQEKIAEFVANRQKLDDNLIAEEIIADMKSVTNAFGNVFHEMNQIESPDDQKSFYSEIICNFRQLLIVGGPGFGKTTFARFLCIEASKGQLFPDLGINEPFIPFFVPLRSYEVFIKKQKNSGRRISILDYLSFKLAEQDLIDKVDTEAFRHIISRNMREGKVIILLDGVDEVSNSFSCKEILQRISEFAARYPNTILVVTSRYMEKLEFLVSKGFLRLNICSLQNFEIHRFIHRWYSFRQPEKDKVDDIATKIMSVLRTTPNLLNLAKNPLMLTIITLIHRIEGIIPEKRVHLYEKVVATFLETWDRVKEIQPHSSLDLIRKCMQVLGFHLQVKFAEQRGTHISSIAAKKYLTDFLIEEEEFSLDQAARESDNLLREFSRRSGVLLFQNDNIFFWHFTFRDFFASQYLLSRYFGNIEKLWEKIKPLFGQHSWYPVLELLFGTLREYRSKLFNDLFERILRIQEISLAHKTTFLVSILSDYPEIPARLRVQVIKNVLDLMTPPNGEENLKFHALGLFEKILNLLNEEIILQIVAMILDDYRFLATPISRMTGEIIQNPAKHFLESLFNRNSDLLVYAIGECIPYAYISGEVVEQLKELSSENFSLLISILEFPNASDESLAKYHAFKTMNLHEILETKTVELEGLLKGQNLVSDELFAAWRKKIDPVLSLCLHFLARIKGIPNSFDLVESSRPITIIGTTKEAESEVPKMPNGIDGITWPIEHNWVALQIDRKFKEILQDFDYKEEHTKLGRTSANHDYFSFTRKVTLEPFQTFLMPINSGLLSGFYKHGLLSFRFRVQMLEQDWYLTKKIEFATEEEKSRFDSLLTRFDDVIHLFDLKIIRMEEFNLAAEGLRLMQEKKFEQALEKAEQSLKLDNRFNVAIHLKADALAAIGNLAESSDISRMMIEKSPKEEWAYHRLTRNLIMQMDFEGILEVSDEALSKDVREPHVLMFRAISLSRLGEYEEATLLLEEASEKLPDSSESLFYLSLHLEQQGKLKEAIETMLKCLEKDPKDLASVVNLFQMNLKVKNFEAANIMFEKAQNLGMNEILTLDLQSQFSSNQKRWNEAYALIERLVVIDPENAGAWYNKACAETGLGQFSLAVKSLRKAIELDQKCRESAQNDSDFDKIREMPSFRDLINGKNTNN